MSIADDYGHGWRAGKQAANAPAPSMGRGVVTGSAEPAGDAAVATGAESTAALTNRGCVWSMDDVGGDSMWETACKNAFYFEGDGTAGPLDAGFTVCPYCAGALSESRTSDAVAER